MHGERDGRMGEEMGAWGKRCAHGERGARIAEEMSAWGKGCTHVWNAKCVKIQSAVYISALINKRPRERSYHQRSYEHLDKRPREREHSIGRLDSYQRTYTADSILTHLAFHTHGGRDVRGKGCTHGGRYARWGLITGKP